MLQTLIQKEQNEIKGTSTSFENAVQKDNPWVKAVYVQNAPFHIIILGTNFFFYLLLEELHSFSLASLFSCWGKEMDYK